MLRATLRESEIRAAIGAPGAGDLVLDGVASLEAGEDRVLYFVNREMPAELCDAFAARQGCLFIVPVGFAVAAVSNGSRVLEVQRPRTAIAKVLALIHAERRLRPWVAGRRIAASAAISPHAVLEGPVDIGDDVVVEAFCTIGPDAAIGRGTIVRAGARIGERVTIGERCVIGRNVVVGEEGYGFVRDDGGDKVRIRHLGGVVIGSDVEIDAQSTIQYGTIAPTIIEDHAKLGMHVGIGHNARIGRNVSLTAGIIVGGSAVIADEVWIGLNASVRNGGRVGAHSLVGMDASVQHDLPDRAVAIARPAHLGKRSDDDDDSVIGFTGRSIDAAPRERPRSKRDAT